MVKSKFEFDKYDLDLFYESFLLLENKDDAVNYLRDLLTEGEIEDFASRFMVARLIESGKSYDEIQMLTKRSTTTIARVSKWLKNGKGGYAKIILKMKNSVNKRFAN